MIAADIGPAATKNFLEKRNGLVPEKLFSELEKEHIGLITPSSQFYPSQLKETPSAPAVIYGRGNLEILKNKSIAVVGSRKFTEYGQRATQNLCRDLVRAGLTIVSGLALGIDAIAHRATLDAEGSTIAVLGTGIDDETIYPRDNFNLAHDILANGGTLITEYPPKTPSLKQNFPARNRIMAGITLGTLVVEAALDSGSLITAGLALESGREVFAVPGPIFSPQSAGANFLLKSGAKLVESATDVLQELNLSESNRPAPQKIYEPKTREEKKIWNALSSDPLHVDRLVKLTRLNPATIGSTLATLEIQGVVKNIGGQNYIRI
ncbi:MAG: DNA protecting protein DprA [Candidatus Moranbacteria bacterium RIFOXYD1_FULL_44_12]|nr:MAG: DNA protecting protein DprA [Candidatus Moranbacteria bacterium RIFOXYD1_FULL_44_12]